VLGGDGGCGAEGRLRKDKAMDREGERGRRRPGRAGRGWLRALEQQTGLGDGKAGVHK